MMAALLVAMGVMAVLLGVLMPVWSTAARREREAELVFRGEQYARAIGLFQRKYANASPPTIDVLVNERFLRRKYVDPITGGDFQVLTTGSALTAGGPGASGAAAPSGSGPRAGGPGSAAPAPTTPSGRGAASRQRTASRRSLLAHGRGRERRRNERGQRQGEDCSLSHNVLQKFLQIRLSYGSVDTTLTRPLVLMLLCVLASGVQAQSPPDSKARCY